jgi:hypothetical protein
MASTNRLSTENRAQTLGCLVEGNSIRATVRMTGTAKNTITKLLVDLGEACTEYQDGVLQSLPCKVVEVDEIWSFCYAKQNLAMRMGMRRFTRLTNGFSRKVKNLSHAVSLHFMHYNFARPHKTLKNKYPRTPAMAAGVADHIWSLEEIAALLD